MLDWMDMAARVEEALGGSNATLFGVAVGVDPKLAATVATQIIREDVEDYISSIPTVPRTPTNKNDAMITLAVIGLVGMGMVGVYKLMKADFEASSSPAKTP